MTTDYNRPTGYPIDAKLGRYEYIGGGSNKFYEVMYCGDNLNGKPQFQVYWGRIGAKKPQGRQLELGEASEKLDEKIRKGYKYVPGSFKSLQQQRHVGMMQVVQKVRGKLNTDTAPTPAPRPKM